MTVSYVSINLCALLISVSVISAQDFANLPLTQENVGCSAIRCPSSKPRCIVEGQSARCVPVFDTSGTNDNRNFNSNSRLSRASPAFTRLARVVRNQQPNSRTSNIPASCLLPAVPGNCRGYFPRYFYNQQTGQCERFTYGGCNGNANNFERMVDCSRTCYRPGIARRPSSNSGVVLNGDSNRLSQPERNVFFGNLFRSQPEPLLSFSSDAISRLGANLGFDRIGRSNQGTIPGNTRNNSPNQSPFSGFAPGGPPPPPRKCLLAMDAGRCEAATKRYFYNVVTKRCEMFTYGGCGGNQNNFQSLDECRRTCDYFEEIVTAQSSGAQGRAPTQHTDNTGVSIIGGDRQKSPGNRGVDSMDNISVGGFAPGAPPPPPRYCFQRYDRGPCLSNIQRFYYNDVTKKCEVFNYGGCAGNQNNFVSVADCRKNCNYYDQFISTHSNNENGGLSQGKGTIVDNSNKKSGTTNNNSNNNNENNNNIPAPGPFGFAPGAPPPLPRVCSLIRETGFCFASIPRFYYNKDTRKCETFNYGGCGGNGNNFQTLEQCSQTCDYFDDFVNKQRNVDLSQKPRAKPAATGAPFLELSAFPTQSGTPFTDLIDNTNQASLDKRPTPSFCYLNKQPGPCRAYIPRFFYNRQNQRCERFIYGGCQSNQNNFYSESECQQVCAGPDDIKNGI